MPKKTVRITIPAAYPNKLAELVENVWNHHASLGASSPLHGDTIVNMTRYEALKTEALEKRKRALALHGEAEALMMQSKNAFGIAAGQKITTDDTLYHLLDNIKRFLMVKHSGTEEDLSPWGFNVVIGTSRVGAKKKKKPL
ncbi:MAG: hypothetical protein V4615_05915 [Bacteroidota bacterium]